MKVSSSPSGPDFAKVYNPLFPQTPEASESIVYWMRILPLLLGGIGIALGFLALIGGLIVMPQLNGVASGDVAVEGSTAAGLILLGFALILGVPRKSGGVLRPLFLSAVLLVLSFNLLVLADHTFSIDLGMSHWGLVEDSQAAGVFSGKMALLTAMNFLLLASGMWIASRNPTWGQILSIMAISVSLLVAVGYLYGVAYMQDRGADSRMAVHTATGFLAIGFGSLFLYPQAGPVSILVRKDVGSLAAWPLLPVIVLFLILLGWAILGGHRLEWYDLPFGMAMYVLLSVLISIGLVWTNAHHLAEKEANRRRAELAVRMHRHWLLTTLSSIGDALLVTDVHGRVQFLNPVAEGLTGWTSEEARNRPVKEVFQIVDQQTLEPLENPLGSVLCTGEKTELRRRALLINRQGQRIPVADSCAPIQGESGECYGAVLVLQNLTHEKAALNELATSEERLKMALEAGKMGTWEWNLSTNEVSWSPTLERLHGFVPGTFDKTFETFQATVHPEDREIVMKSIRQALEQKKAHHIEYRAVRPDGRLCWFEVRGDVQLDAKGQVIGMTGICMDISEQKDSEDALKRTTRQLEQTKEKLTTILHSITDAFISLDSNWKCLFVNPSAAALLGRNPDHLLGKHLWDAIPEWKNSSFQKEFEECWSSLQPRSFETFFAPHDTWYECHCYPSEEILSIIFTDISRRKRDELMSRSTSEHLALAITEAQGGFWDMELWPDRSEIIPEHCFFSPRLKAVLGYEEDELPNRLSAWFNRVHQEDLSQLENAMRLALNDPQSHFDAQFRVRDRNGDYRWFHSRGKVFRDEKQRAVRWTAATLDITERKLEEERQAQLAAIIHGSQHAIIRQSFQGDIVSWNSGAARMYGYNAEEVVGKNIIDVIIPPEKQAEHRNALFCISNGKSIPPYETLRRDKAGRILSIFLALSPIKDSDGRTIGISAIGTDITRRKEMEAQKEKLNLVLASVLKAFPDIVWVINPEKEVQFLNPAAESFFRQFGPPEELPEVIQNQIQTALETGLDYLPTDFRGVHQLSTDDKQAFYLCRLVVIKKEDGTAFGLIVMLQDVTDFRMLDEVKTNLIATVSHEIKTPLTSIRMSLLLLLEENIGQLTYDQKELTTTARVEVERLLRTLNVLLDITRFELGNHALNYQYIQVSQIIQAALESIMSAVEVAHIKLQTEIDPAAVTTIDADRDRIVHVLSNLLTNAIKHSPRDASVKIAVRRHDADHTHIGVIDSGKGIPKEYQDRIFDRFFKLPGNSMEGTGLGLAIAKEFIHAHDGQIGVNSELGHGSEFYVILPNRCTRSGQGD